MQRLFVAIPLPPAVGILVRRFAEREAAAFPGARWVPPTQLHVTLKFLGDVDDATALAARKAIGSVSTPEPIALRFGKRVRLGDGQLLAFELAGDVDQLADYRAQLEAAFERLGFERDARPFLPHVTVARDVGPGLAPGLRGPKASAPGGPKDWFVVNSVRLIRSTPGPDGSTYETVLALPMIDRSTL